MSLPDNEDIEVSQCIPCFECYLPLLLQTHSIGPVNKCTYYVPSSLPGSEDKSLNKTDTNLFVSARF